MQAASRRTNDPLDVLKVCDPVRRARLATHEIEGALNELGAAITSAPVSTRGTAKRSMFARRAVLVAALIAVVITAGIATAAAVWSAHTGRFPTKAEEAIGGPGEALDPAAPDFREVALEIGSDIPYPAAYASWRNFVITREIRTASSGLISTGALHGWFAASAFCAWVQAWRHVDVTGEAGLASRAAAVIEQAPGWRAVTDEDPRPDPSAPNDLGAETGTLFGWMLPYRDAVLAGDRARVEHLLATGYGQGKCWSSDPDWMAQLAAHDGWGKLSKAELAQRYRRFLATERS